MVDRYCQFNHIFACIFIIYIVYFLYIFILTAQVSQDSDARRELLKAYFAEDSEEA